MELDPESLIGAKSAVLKVAVAGAMLGILYRREFSFAQAVSSFSAGVGSAAYIAPGVLAHSGIQHEDIRGAIIFATGVLGGQVFKALMHYAPGLLRKLAARLGLEPAKVDDKPGGSA